MLLPMTSSALLNVVRALTPVVKGADEAMVVWG